MMSHIEVGLGETWKYVTAPKKNYELKGRSFKKIYELAAAMELATNECETLQFYGIFLE